MLSNFGLEKHFWAEAVRIACYLINRSLTTALDGGIPEEVWTGKKVNYSHLKIFGCEAFVHIGKEKITKLDNKSMKCIFLGYADGEFGYQLWDPVKSKVIRSNDVKFKELDVDVFVTSECIHLYILYSIGPRCSYRENHLYFFVPRCSYRENY